MRMTAEACDYVVVPTGLACRELEHAAIFLWGVFDEVLRELHRSLQIREILGVARGKKKKVFSQGLSRAA